jgi:FKBP-type peptidyl-prolyl cis-trans isomerase
MLENMKGAESVRELDGGVLLHVLEHGPEGEGKGVRPTVGSTVSIHYHGEFHSFSPSTYQLL